MKTIQTGLVRALQGSLSDLARTCTRYNKPVDYDKLGAVDVSCYNSKLVIANYTDRLTCFTLKVAVITPDLHVDVNDDTLDAMMSNVIAIMATGDCTFKLVGSAADGLKHSGLNSSYVYALRDIADCIADASSSIGHPVTKIQYVASAIFGNPCVGLVFKYANSVCILQFKD